MKSTKHRYYWNRAQIFISTCVCLYEYFHFADATHIVITSCCHCVFHHSYINVCTIYTYKWNFWNFRLTGVVFSHYNWICVLFPLCHCFAGDLFTAIILKLSGVIIHHVLDYVCCNCVIINSALFYPQKCPIWVIHFVVPLDTISLSSFSHASWHTII